MKLRKMISFLLMLCVMFACAGTVYAGEAASASDGEVLEIDLTKGYYECTLYGKDGNYSYLSDLEMQAICDSVYHAIYRDGAGINFDFTADLDYDGTIDLISGAYDYPTEEGMPARYFLIPASTSSICGACEIPLPLGSYSRGDYTTVRNYTTVRFYFPEEPVQKEYQVTVENGHAETKDGKTVTSAAPGTLLYLVPDALDGKFVARWDSELIHSFSRYVNYGNYWDTCAVFTMPAADVTFAAERGQQTPLTFDLTPGFCLGEQDAWEAPGLYDIMPESADHEKRRFDLDGDGTEDVCYFPLTLLEIEGPNPCDDYIDHTYVIPLATSSIRGSYTLEGKSTSAYWPLTFKFPDEPLKQFYSVTVTGGHAEDGAGRTITEAAPGDWIKIVYDEKEGVIFDREFMTLPEYEDLNDPWNMRENVVMPACNITYIALTHAPGKEKDGDLYPIYSDCPCTIEGAYGEDVSKGAREGQEIFVFYEGDDLTEDFRLYSPDVQITVEYGTSGMYFTFIMPAHEVRLQATREKFPITVINGGAGYQFYEPITEAYPGEWIIVYPFAGPRDDGYYYTGNWSSDDVTLNDYKEGAMSIIMPDHAVTVTAEIKKQEPVTVDLRSGSAKVTWEIAVCLLDASGSEKTFFDLNGDRTDDVIIDFDNEIIKVLPNCTCTEPIELTGRTEGPYYPVTVLFDENTPKTVQPTVTEEVKPTETVPAPDTANEKEKEKKARDSFNLFYIFIPAILVLGGIVTAWVLLSKRAKKSSAESEENSMT